jgi:hypothetical protein
MKSVSNAVPIESFEDPSMKFRLTVILCLFLTVNALAQEKALANKLSARLNPDAAAAEARSRKLWQDFKNRNKTALAAILADGFRALEEGANGFADAKEYLSTLDDFELKSYDLSDYAATPLGADSVLVNYHARYEGVSGKETTQGNAGFSEVWVRRDEKWKIQYLQETYWK